jgi:hypothetical protein
VLYSLEEEIFFLFLGTKTKKHLFIFGLYLLHGIESTVFEKKYKLAMQADGLFFFSHFM